MLLASDFQYFDPDAEVKVTHGHLPHWEQAGATYFITYRTVDSLAQEAMDRILRIRNDWLYRHGIDASRDDWSVQIRRLSNEQRQAFAKVFAIEAEKSLDQLCGTCLLRDPKLRNHVTTSLHHFNDERYLIAAFVVMPNHVHVLARIFPQYQMLQQCFGWKHFQAHKINQSNQTSGSVFASESFDHIVRDAEHLRKFVEYIRRNPDKAGLKPDEYTLYLPEIDFSR